MLRYESFFTRIDLCNWVNNHPEEINVISIVFVNDHYELFYFITNETVQNAIDEHIKNQLGF